MDCAKTMGWYPFFFFLIGWYRFSHVRLAENSIAHALTKLAKEIEGESILNGIGSYTSCKLA